MLGDPEDMKDVNETADNLEANSLGNKVDMDGKCDESDEDDDGPIIRSKPKKRVNVSILEDSDDDEDGSDEVSKVKEVEDDETDDEDDGNMDPIDDASANKSMRRVKRIQESSDEEDERPQPAEPDSPQASTSGLASQQVKLNDDLFDAEMDNSEGNSDKENQAPKEVLRKCEDSSSSEGEEVEDQDDDEEGDDSEPVVSEALRRRLMKGASKSPRAKRKASIKALEMQKQEIFSESQRMLRESAVRLPYHQPKKPDLSAILAKTRMKQEKIGEKSRLLWKKVPESTLSEAPKDIPSLESESNDVATCVLKESTPATPLECSSVDKPSIDLDDDDDLPDLFIETVPQKKESSETAEQTSDCVVMDFKVETQPEEISLFIGPDDKKTDEKEEVTIYIGPEAGSGEGTKGVGEKKPERDSQDSGCVVVSPFDSEDEIRSDKPEAKTPVDGNKKVKGLGLTPDLAALSLMPKLTKESDFIDLDEEESVPADSDVDHLFDRLVKHQKTAPKKDKDVLISTVCKKKVDGDKEELQMESFTYHVEAESSALKRGAKLLDVKQELKEKIKIQKRKSREERLRVHQLENEEGYEGTRLEEDPLDIEDELSDQTDTDGGDDEEDEEDEEYLDEEEYGAGEKVAQRNPFVEMEAEDEDEEMADYDEPENEDSLHLQLDSDGDSGEEGDAEDGNPAIPRPLGVFDEDANTESPTVSQKSNPDDLPELVERPFIQLSGDVPKPVTEEDDAKMEEDSEPLVAEVSLPLDDTNASILSANSSMDLTSENLSSAQHQNRLNVSRGSDRVMTPELFTPSTKGSIGISKFSSELSLPPEDSQDLLTCGQAVTNSHVKSQMLAESTPAPSHYQDSFVSLMDDIGTQSQLLDADGLLKAKEPLDAEKHKSRRQLLMEGSIKAGFLAGEEEDDMWALCSGRFTQGGDSESGPPLSQNHGKDDLIGLCSGGFGTCEDIQDKAVSNTQGEMSELLGLCSGRFVEEKSSQEKDTLPGLKDAEPEDPDSPIKVKRTKRRKAIVQEDEEEDKKSEDSFCIDTEAKPKTLNDDDEELNSDEENVPSLKFGGFLQGKAGKIRKEFVEDEAELSGSEAESDENYDIAEDDDVLELEDGDLDNLGSRKALHDQVNRLHLKSMIDSDKREIRLLQEMYLPDGDLHSEGQGRQRRFRWANIDEEDTQKDMFKDSDAEEEGNEEEEAERERKWRLERHEREKFIAEQENSQNPAEEGDSQMLKLGKVVFKSAAMSKPKAAPMNQPQATNKGAPSNPVSSVVANPRNIFKSNTLHRSGSFLSKGKNALAKIAEVTKPVTDTLGGPRNSRNFVFSAVKQEEQANDQKKPQVKRSSSVNAAKPESKRPKLERTNTLPTNSIFNHM